MTVLWWKILTVYWDPLYTVSILATPFTSKFRTWINLSSHRFWLRPIVWFYFNIARASFHLPCSFLCWQIPPLSRWTVRSYRAWLRFTIEYYRLLCWRPGSLLAQVVTCSLRVFFDFCDCPCSLSGGFFQEVMKSREAFFKPLTSIGYV